MVQVHTVNYNLSIQLHEELKSYIKPNHCYNNVFEVFNHYKEKFDSGQWKVAYGYEHGGFERLMVRHGYVLDENNLVIDVTLPFSELNRGRDEEYHTFAVLTGGEYFHLLKENNGLPALIGVPELKEQEMFKWAWKNNYILIGT